MEYKKYQHVERYGTEGVDGINKGKCYIFPKIDGTNGTVWLQDGTVMAGSRRRELTIDDDNAGFYKAISSDERFKKYFRKFPNHRLYGEWLVPHTIRKYKDDAWEKFYVFDVCVDDNSDDGMKYLPYEFYKPFLEEFNINYVPLLKIINDGELNDFTKCLDENHFLVKEGMGSGEGIVIKNYEFKNKYNRACWAKIVCEEFVATKRNKKPKNQVENHIVELDIVDKFVTIPFIEKEYAKIALDGWNSKKIPMLLNIVYHELINEEMWNILKKFNNPTVNFKTLQNATIQKIKTVKPQLFM